MHFLNNKRTLRSLSSPSPQTFRLVTARIHDYLVFFFFSWLKRGYINKRETV